MLTDRQSNLLKAYTSSIGPAADHKNPIKKVHSVANKLFIVIDETIAKSLDISENDTWFEQIQIEDGILLRKHQYPLNEIEGVT